MTNLYDTLITDLLQNGAGYNPEIQALAYALREEKRRVMEHADQTRTMAMINTLPEEILNVLAVELRAPAYSVELPLETKRSLITGTLNFYKTLGTPASVDWVVKTVFGNGGIEEWFDYGGEPFRFKVDVNNNSTFTSLDNLEEFLRLVNTSKRLSAWLDDIDVVTELPPCTLHLGAPMCMTTRVPLPSLDADA
jgi:phage tail P2-like protein